MKFLITGAGGQLGQEWIAFCAKNKIEFKAYDSKSLDITNKNELSKICEETGPDVFVNCAAYTKVDLAEGEPELAEKINSEAVSFISSICEEKSIKLVHYSTDYVFSGTKEDRKLNPEGYPEDFKPAPLNVYGITKRKGEIAVINSGCSYLLLRVSWLCGRFGNNFVKTMIRLGAGSNELRVVNDQFGSPTFTNQVVEQSFKLIEEKNEGLFHLGSGGITTWYELAKKIFSEKEMEVHVIPVNSNAFPTKAKRPSFSKLSTQKISTIPDIKILSWQEGLKNLINTI